MARMALVETTQSVFLMDPNTGAEISAFRPSVAEWSSFLEMRVGLGQVRVIAADLLPEATDEAFLGYWTESDKKVDLAVAAFLAAFTQQLDLGAKEPVPAVQQKADKVVPATKTKE